MRLLGAPLILLAVALLTACGGEGGDGGGEEAATTVERTGPCSEVELVEVEATAQHSDRNFTAPDYETNPPAGGPHNSEALAAGTFYPDPPRLGEAVHLLEHGAVIGWTNDLSAEDRKTVESAFNDLFDPEGYFQLAVVENPGMGVPFALSAWGAVQTCEEVDPSVIRRFIEDHYATERSAEGFAACPARAPKIPNCR